MSDEIRLRIAELRGMTLDHGYWMRPSDGCTEISDVICDECRSVVIEWNPTTNIIDAWELVEEAEREGCGYTMSDCHHSDGRITHDFAFFAPVGGPVAHKYCADDAETVPIAICEAWLKREEGKNE